MKMEDYSTLLALSLEDLTKKLYSAKKEKMDIQMSIRTGQEKNTAKMRNARKMVARISSAIAQKK